MKHTMTNDGYKKIGTFKLVHNSDHLDFSRKLQELEFDNIDYKVTHDRNLGTILWVMTQETKNKIKKQTI